MARKPTLTIGIPAFNEAANIANLLSDIKEQKIKNAKLVQVVVLSDGSSDETVASSRQFGWPLVIVKAFTVRKGKAFRLNQLFAMADSDVVVVLDADLRLVDPQCLEKVIAPVVEKKSDLTSARVEETLAKTFTSRILQASMEWKKYVFTKFRRGDNIYTCHGRCRAFSKQLYKAMKFKDSSSEDAFSFLYAKLHGFEYQYVNKAAVYYQLPLDLADHVQQSLRFNKSRAKLIAAFGEQIVTDTFALPKSLLIQTFLLHLIQHPIELTGYVVVQLYIKFLSLTKDINYSTWSMATSSKKVTIS